MPRGSWCCLGVHFITSELFVAKKVTRAESAKSKDNSRSACPSQFSAAATQFPSEQSLQIPNIAMKHFTLFLSSNPFQNKISLGVIKKKKRQCLDLHDSLIVLPFGSYKLAPKLWSCLVVCFFFFSREVVNLNLCRSTVMISPSDYEGFLITFNI